MAPALQMNMCMTENQMYSLVSIYAQSGNMQEVVTHVINTFPQYGSDARKFLALYQRYHKGKLNRPGNGYVDVEAFKRACAMMAKGEDFHA